MRAAVGKFKRVQSPDEVRLSEPDEVAISEPDGDRIEAESNIRTHPVTTEYSIKEKIEVAYPLAVAVLEEMRDLCKHLPENLKNGQRAMNLGYCIASLQSGLSAISYIESDYRWLAKRTHIKTGWRPSSLKCRRAQNQE
jgi:hypothetical protein